MSKKEIEIVHNRNNEHNNFREDYNYQDYQSGKNWSSFKEQEDYRNYLKFIPLFNKKTKVLEIGPGSGYYSRFICENENVECYSFCELNVNFRNHLKDNLKQLQMKKKNFRFNSFETDFLEDSHDEKYDYIFFISSFHHIPNRKDYFKRCFELLNTKGKIIFFEPTHYIFRILILIRKFFKLYRHYDKSDVLKNCGTHAFCTLGEFKEISKDYKNVYDYKCTWILRSKKIKKIINYVKPKFLNNFFLKYFSAEMVIVFEKK